MQLNFDARSVAPDVGFEAIPPAWYIAMIDNSETKPTSDGQGAYLELRYNILEGAHKGSKQFVRLNLKNNNDKAVEIAYRQLSAICHAIGVMQVTDSNQLHGIPHKIKVTVRKGGPKKDKITGMETGEMYEDSNEVKGWKNVNEPTPDAPVAAAAAPQGFSQPAQQQAPQGWGAPAPTQQPPAQGGWGQQPMQQPPQGQQPWGGQPQQQAPAPAPVQQAAPPWGSPPQPAQQPQQAPQQPWGAQAPTQQVAAQQGAPWAQQPAAQPPQQQPNGANMAAPQAQSQQAPPWAQPR